MGTASKKMAPAPSEAKVKEAFEWYDQDRKGVIKVDKLGVVVRSLGYNPTSSELKSMVSTGDAEGNGTIDFATFKELMANKKKDEDSEDEIVKAFKSLDHDNSGFVNVKELRLVLTSTGEKLSAQEIQEMVDEADPQKTGKVNYKEFVKAQIAM